MEKMPIVLPPFEDEMLYSYLFRLATANGFHTLHKFYNSFVTTNINELSRHQIRYDCYFYFLNFYRSLDCSESPLKLFKALSIYPGIAPFMLPSKQNDVINYCFRNHNVHPLLYKYIIGSTQTLKYCPLCVQEELQENGTWYYHRSHQMPGVKICHKHNVYLITYNGKHEHEFDTDALSITSSSVTYSKFPQELNYAKYTNALLQMDIQSEYNITLGIVKNQLLTMGLGKMGFKELVSYLKDSGSIILFQNNLDEMIKRLRNYVIRPETDELLALTYIAFPDISSFKKNSETSALNKYGLYITSHVPLCITGEETICKKCDTPVFTTAYGHYLGWDMCDKCESEISDEDKFAETIKQITNGEYSLVGNFTGYQSNITVKHHICGKEYDIRAKNFLQGSRCMCEQRISDTEIKQRAKDILGEEYQLVSIYVDNATKYIIVKHLPCGKKINIHYYSLVQHGVFHCPNCHSTERRDKRSNEDYLSIVKDLVGSEYTVLDEYTTALSNITIMHSVCGYSSKYVANDFLYGRRCPLCTRPLSYNEVSKYVLERTNNEYCIIGRDDKSYYAIKNNKTGITNRLTKSRIMQEFNRPTPSPILPIDGTYHNSIVHLDTLESRVIIFIKRNHAKSDRIQIAEISEGLSISKGQARGCVKHLIKRGYLEKVDLHSFRVKNWGMDLPDIPKEDN